MSSRLLTRGLSTGKAISILSRGLIFPQILARPRKLRGNIYVMPKMRGQVWKVK